MRTTTARLLGLSSVLVVALVWWLAHQTSTARPRANVPSIEETERSPSAPPAPATSVVPRHFALRTGPKIAPGVDDEQPRSPLPSRQYGDGDQPHTSRPPRVTSLGAPDPLLDLFDDSPMGRKLAEYINSLNDVGPEADRRLAKLLKELQANPTEAVRLLGDQYRRLPPEQYSLRESVTQTLSDVASHESVQQLAEILKAPLELTKGRADVHANGYSAQEGMVRYAALEGLESLAGMGDSAAEKILADVMVNGNPTMRQQATVAYVQAGPDPRSRMAQAASLLPEGDRWMVNTTVIRTPDMPEYSPEDPGSPTHPDQPSGQTEKAPPAAATGDSAGPAPGSPEASKTPHSPEPSK